MVVYPKREPFFAHKFVRLLTKSCAAQDIGLNAFALLCVVAHQEDSARYLGAVRFWNEQLMNVLGFKSPKQLNDCRAKAIEFGWLSYERTGNREVGRYFVIIPDAFEGLDDSPIESNHSVNHSESGTNSGTNKERIAERLSDGSRNESVRESGKPSIPTPYPIPDPEEVQADESATASDLPAVVESEASGPANIIAAQYTTAIGGRITVTAKRRKVIAVRWRDQFWRDNWQEALEVASSTPFLQGQNDRAWKMSFDWFLQPDSVAKILEGNYSGGTKHGNQTAAEKREQLNASGFDWIRQAAAEAAAIGGSDHRGNLPASTGKTLFLEEHGPVDATCV